MFWPMVGCHTDVTISNMGSMNVVAAAPSIMAITSARWPGFLINTEVNPMTVTMQATETMLAACRLKTASSGGRGKPRVLTGSTPLMVRYSRGRSAGLCMVYFPVSGGRSRKVLKPAEAWTTASTEFTQRAAVMAIASTKLLPSPPGRPI